MVSPKAGRRRGQERDSLAACRSSVDRSAQFLANGASSLRHVASVKPSTSALLRSRSLSSFHGFLLAATDCCRASSSELPPRGRCGLPLCSRWGDSAYTLGSEDLRPGSCTGLGSGSGSVGVLPDCDFPARALGLTGAGAGAGAAPRGDVASSLRFGGILQNAQPVRYCPSVAGRMLSSRLGTRSVGGVALGGWRGG